MYALFFPKQDSAARLTNPELKIVFLFLTESAKVILFHRHTDSGSGILAASARINLHLLHCIDEGTCRATGFPEYFLEDRPVNIFGKIVDVS